MLYVLCYDYVPDIAERRAPFRPAHLGLVRAHHERGEIVIAGALEEPLDAALIVFNSDSPAVAEAFVRDDPYVANGLVTRWRIRPWNVVVGAPRA